MQVERCVQVCPTSPRCWEKWDEPEFKDTGVPHFSLVLGEVRMNRDRRVPHFSLVVGRSLDELGVPHFSLVVGRSGMNRILRTPPGAPLLPSVWNDAFRRRTPFERPHNRAQPAAITWINEAHFALLEQRQR
jgi:hypothetical protein